MPKGGTSLVASHPDKSEITQHLIHSTLTMADIERQYSTEKHPLTYEAIRWYRDHHLQDRLDEAEESLQEEIEQEFRVLKYRTIDMINGMLADAVRRFNTGKIAINTVNEIVKLLELKAKIEGELDQNISIQFGWGDKFKFNPRFKKDKGKIYTLQDLEKLK